MELNDVGVAQDECERLVPSAGRSAVALGRWICFICAPFREEVSLALDVVDVGGGRRAEARRARRAGRHPEVDKSGEPFVAARHEGAIHGRACPPYQA